MKRQKYPYLEGCYVEEEFDRTYARRFLQAEVNLYHHKGAMLLRVTEEEKLCGCAPRLGVAWLRGDDLDAMIAMLREAKRVWLRAYRKAEVEMRQLRAEKKQPKKARAARGGR